MMYEILDFRVEPVRPFYEVACPYCFYSNTIRTLPNDVDWGGNKKKVETERTCPSCKKYFQIGVKYDLRLVPIKYDEPF